MMTFQKEKRIQMMDFKIIPKRKENPDDGISKRFKKKRESK